MEFDRLGRTPMECTVNTFFVDDQRPKFIGGRRTVGVFFSFVFIERIEVNFPSRVCRSGPVPIG
jgi:hypothetical protein